MSVTLATIVQPAGTTRFGASLRILGACWERVARYLIHRAAIAALRERDDRILGDMGIARSEIAAAVHGLITPSNRSRART